MYYSSSTHHFTIIFIIFIVKSLVLFVLHPSFFHCNLYYSHYAPFFSLQTNVLFVKKPRFSSLNHLYYLLYTLLFCKSRQCFTKGPEIFFLFFVFFFWQMYYSSSTHYFIIIFIFFIVKSIVLFTLHPSFFHRNLYYSLYAPFFLFRQMYYL